MTTSSLPAAVAELILGLPLPCAVVDREMRYLLCNEAWEQAYGLPATALGSPEVAFPALRSEFRKTHLDCLDGKASTQETGLFERADGTPDALRWTVVPWRDAAGAIGGAVMITESVTEEVLARRKLAERDAFIRDLFDASPAGFTLCSTDGRLLDANQAFLDLIGLSHEDLGRITYWEITPTEYEPQETEQLRNLFQSGRHGPYEKEFMRSDGSTVPVRIKSFMAERDEEQYIWSMVEDISEHRQLEKRLDQEKQKARHSAKLATLGQMAAGIAHEINNPLAIIELYAGQLEEAIADGDASLIKEAVDSIRESVERAGQIVRSLGRLSRKESGDPAQVIAVDGLVKSALALSRSRARNEGVRLKVDVQCGAHVEVGPVELTQVLLNLLNNAIDATRDQKDRWVHCSVTAGTDDDGTAGQVIIAVEDSGPGIPPEQRLQIFEPFFTTKPVGEGTGLGLSVSQSIVESLRGSLVLDEGAPHTRFVVRLPVVDP